MDSRNLATTAETTIAPNYEANRAEESALFAWLRRAIAMLVAVALFFGFFRIYTLHNTQPMHYHPDEEGKGEQALYDWRNWNHPALLLDATAEAVRAFEVEEDVEKVVIAGRHVSAAFAAASVVALALIGYIDAGLLGMAIVGLLVGFSPSLQTHAHYMKEDTILWLGVTMMLLGTRLAFVRFRWWAADLASVIVLGAGCSIAISGKYIGALTIIPAALLLFGWQRRWWTDLILRPVIFIASLIGAAWWLNTRAVREWDEMWGTLSRSADQPLRNAIGGAILPVPNTWFLKVILEVVPIETWLLVIAAIAMLAITRRKRSAWHYVLVGLTILTAGTLCFCRQGFGRYVLPAVAMIDLLGALGTVWIVRELLARTSAHRAVAGALLAIVVSLGAYRAIDTDHQFADDSRDRLKKWMAANLKPGDRVLGENYAGFGIGMSGNNRQLEVADGVTLDTTRFAADFGSFDDFRSYGYTHVVICELAYDRFLSWAPDGTPEAEEVASYRDWYRAVLKCQPAWHVRPTHDLNALTNPDIRVYALPAARNR